MRAPPPAFTIRNPTYVLSDDITPFRDYDYFGPLWNPIPFFNSSKHSFSEEWTTNQLITIDQIVEYGAYYVGERSDMYAICNLVYYLEGKYMPSFRKITDNDMFTNCHWMRIMGRMNRLGYNIRSGPFSKPVVSVNSLPQPGNSYEKQLKRLEIVVNMDGVKLNPNPNETAADPIDGNDYMKEDGDGEDGANFLQDEIIEDYFSDKASSSESPSKDDDK